VTELAGTRNTLFLHKEPIDITVDCAPSLSHSDHYTCFDFCSINSHHLNPIEANGIAPQPLTYGGLTLMELPRQLSPEQAVISQSVNPCPRLIKYDAVGGCPVTVLEAVVSFFVIGNLGIGGGAKTGVPGPCRDVEIEYVGCGELNGEQRQSQNEEDGYDMP